MSPAGTDIQQRDMIPQLAGDLRGYRGNPLFLGVSPRLRDRTDERDAAILHVAEQASRYVRFFAQYRYIVASNGGDIGYVDDISGSWDDEYADSLVDSVEVIRELQDGEATYVVAYVPGLPTPPNIPDWRSSPDGSPRWIERPPDVPGYITAVGLSTPSRRIRNSIDRADQAALQQILLNAGTTVRMIQDVVDRQRHGTQATTTSAQEAAATLRHFYVVARYISPDGRYFYSLAVAREE